MFETLRNAISNYGMEKALHPSKYYSNNIVNDESVVNFLYNTYGDVKRIMNIFPFSYENRYHDTEHITDNDNHIQANAEFHAIMHAAALLEAQKGDASGKTDGSNDATEQLIGTKYKRYIEDTVFPESEIKVIKPLTNYIFSQLKEPVPYPDAPTPTDHSEFMMFEAFINYAIQHYPVLLSKYSWNDMFRLKPIAKRFSVDLMNRFKDDIANLLECTFENDEDFYVDPYRRIVIAKGNVLDYNTIIGNGVNLIIFPGNRYDYPLFVNSEDNKKLFKRLIKANTPDAHIELSDEEIASCNKNMFKDKWFYKVIDANSLNAVLTCLKAFPAGQKECFENNLIYLYNRIVVKLPLVNKRFATFRISEFISPNQFTIISDPITRISPLLGQNNVINVEAKLNNGEAIAQSITCFKNPDYDPSDADSRPNIFLKPHYMLHSRLDRDYRPRTDLFEIKPLTRNDV